MRVSKAGIVVRAGVSYGAYRYGGIPGLGLALAAQGLLWWKNKSKGKYSLHQKNEFLKEILENRLQVDDAIAYNVLYNDYMVDAAIHCQNPLHSEVLERMQELYRREFILPKPTSSSAPRLSTVLSSSPSFESVPRSSATRTAASSSSPLRSGSSSAISAPFIGLQNIGNDCCFNAVLQFIYNNPDLKAWLMGPTCPHDLISIQRLFRSYERDKLLRRDVCSVSSNSLRTAFQEIAARERERRVAAGIVTGPVTEISSHGQECAHEIFSIIMSYLPKNSTLIKAIRNYRIYSIEGHPLPGDVSLEVDRANKIAISKGPVNRDGSLAESDWGNIILQVPKDKDNRTSLFNGKLKTLNGQDLIFEVLENRVGGESGRYFTQSGTRHAYPKIGEMRVYNRPPPFLFVSVKRHEYDRSGRLQKRTSPINMPLGPMEFPGKYFNSRTPVRYQLVSLVRHIGRSGEGGHYVSYNIGDNGKWYYLNDGKVHEMPTFEEGLSQGYMYQFRRLD